MGSKEDQDVKVGGGPAGPPPTLKTVSAAAEKQRKKRKKAEEVGEEKEGSAVVEKGVSSKKPDEEEEEKEEKWALEKHTPAQLAYEKIQEKRQIECVLKKASKTHKQRVKDFNRYLDILAEHYDIPKVSWTK